MSKLRDTNSGAIPDARTPPVSSNAERVKALQAKLSEPPPASLSSVLMPQERDYLCFLWEIDQAELAARDLADHAGILEYLRPPARWAEGSAQGTLVTEKTISIPIVGDGLIDIRTIDKGTRLHVGLDCTAIEAQKWLAAGLVRSLPCTTVRALITTNIGVSVPTLVRGQLLTIEGGGEERLLLHLLELGYAEFICAGAYRDDPAALRQCPLPRKSLGGGKMVSSTSPDGTTRQVYVPGSLSSEFVRAPRPLGSDKFDWTSTPIAIFETNESGRYGEHFRWLGGDIVRWHVFAGLKIMADPTTRTRHGEPALKFLGIVGRDPVYSSQEIHHPLSDQAKAWFDDELVPFMLAHPGALMNAPGFPIPPEAIWTAAA